MFYNRHLVRSSLYVVVGFFIQSYAIVNTLSSIFTNLNFSNLSKKTRSGIFFVKYLS